MNLLTMLKFFDCNAFLGRPARRDVFPPAATAADFIAEMDFCGVDQALAWHIAQFDASPQLGNRLIAEEIDAIAQSGQPRLVGCWSILPNQAREFAPFNEFLRQMRAAGVAALRAFPTAHHFLLNEVAMGAWLEPMTAHRVPLLLSVTRGADWNIAYALLAEFPNLVCILCDHGCWGEDRYFRPLIERYPNVYIDTAAYLLDGGIERFVADYGPRRMLFGSGFPLAHFGGMMLAIRHAKISEEAKTDIAGANLQRILGEVCW